MALWQISFFVLPKNSLESTSNDKFEDDDEHLFDDALFWQPLKLNPDFFDNINSILPRRNSWCDNIVLFGEQNSNCFEVFFENNIVLSVSFRIDFTNNYQEILIQLIDFFVLNGLIILDENLNIIPLDFEIIKNKIENHSQVETYKILQSKKE